MEMMSVNSLIAYKEYKCGHLSFLIPRTMEIYQDVMSLLQTHNSLY